MTGCEGHCVSLYVEKPPGMQGIRFGFGHFFGGVKHTEDNVVAVEFQGGYVSQVFNKEKQEGFFHYQHTFLFLFGNQEQRLAGLEMPHLIVKTITLYVGAETLHVSLIVLHLVCFHSGVRTSYSVVSSRGLEWR